MIAERAKDTPVCARAFTHVSVVRYYRYSVVAWGMVDINPAKVGVDNPVRRRKEQHPFESWVELEALAEAIGPRYGPMILFAAATGLRPAEWTAVEKRDIDRKERVVYVRRSFTRGELKIPKTEASMRAVPLQARALDALDRIKNSDGSPLLFPGERGGYLDIHHFRPFQWATCAKGGRYLAAATDLRSPAHVCDLRPSCRHLNLRPLSLHGRQPDDDRPPLRPPRPRRTRARDQAPRRIERCGSKNSIWRKIEGLASGPVVRTDANLVPILLPVGPRNLSASI
jgi:integrase